MNQSIIIVGAGIAGLSIAYQLDKHQIPYQIYDTGTNQSSRIAAGIINPVVFRRMALSWRISELLPEAIKFYRELEKKYNQKYLYQIPIRRAFAHQQEIDLWKKKLEDPAYNNFLKPIEEEDLSIQSIEHSFGTGVVKESYWIDTKRLLDDWHDELKSKGNLITTVFDYSKIQLDQNKYDGKEYAKVIFCEGYHGIENPFFNYLPLQATKGELLTVKNTFIPENESFNYKCFILPIGNHEFKVGATYSWNSPNVFLTEEAKTELKSHFENLVKSEYRVIHHEAGVRPTVLDRRPLLGEHPIHKNLMIYNGLGAKGYLITPRLAKEFIDYLLNQSELDHEINIKRYEYLLLIV